MESPTVALVPGVPPPPPSSQTFTMSRSTLAIACLLALVASAAAMPSTPEEQGAYITEALQNIADSGLFHAPTMAEPSGTSFALWPHLGPTL